jgi:hypothetical protein
MELMNQVVEICGPDFVTLPSVALRPKSKESTSSLRTWRLVHLTSQRLWRP